MINSIFGTISAKLPQTVCVETSSGIEWELCVSETTLNALPPIENSCRIYCYLLHKEDSMKLFGFSCPEERSVFLDLLKVDGVGPRGAIKILSNMPYENLIKILEDEDINSLEKVPGVGKKTAQKMLLSLKGKLSLLTGDNFSGKNTKLPLWNDVVVALVGMGYEKGQVEQVVESIALSLPNELTQTQKEDTILRKAIIELAM